MRKGGVVTKGLGLGLGTTAYATREINRKLVIRVEHRPDAWEAALQVLSEL